MAAPDLVAPMNYIVTLLAGTTGIQSADTGTPLVLTHRVSAFVDFLGQVMADRASSQLKQTAGSYYVGIGYRVQGAEGAASLGLAAAVPAFIDRFYSQGTPIRTLNDTCDEAKLEADVAPSPVYVTFGGQEFKIVPLRIIAIIRHQ